MVRTRIRWPGALRALTIANAVFLLVLYVGESLVAERHWLTTLVTYAPQHLFGVPLAALLLVSVARRRWRLACLNALAAVLFLVTFMGLNVPLRTGVPNGGHSVRVITYNIHHPSDVAPIVKDVVAARPDVVCFQEANSIAGRPDPQTDLSRLLAGWHSVSYGELAVFSRLPIVRTKIHYPSTQIARLYLEVGLNAHGRRLTVIALHLSTAVDSSTLSHHRGSMASYLRSSARIRSRQVEAALKIVEGIDGPVVIAGDFNTPPRGMVYRRMAGSFTDCFSRAGWGCGFTFRSDLPVMRIDYIWAGDGLAPVHSQTLALKHSDHRPVIADICFTD